MRTQTFMLLFLICAKLCSYGQDQRSQTDSLYSKILKQMRPVEIVYPKQYDAAKAEKYELIYCLDGIPTTLKFETAFLQSEGFIPEQIILIGIPNISVGLLSTRDRDLTPTVTGPNTGGAVTFLSFIKQELMPYIETKINTKPSGHSLYGASLAGLFALYTFLNDPELFSSYIAIDPSLWWDGFYMRRAAIKRFGAMRKFRQTLYIAGREGSAFRAMGIASIDSLLKAKAPDGLQWKCATYTDETHYSTMFKGFWDGMKFSYGGFYAARNAYPASRKIILKPLTGIVLEDVPFPLICSNIGAGSYIHYTINGSIPSIKSARLLGQETPVQLSEDAQVKVGSFGVREEYNRSAWASFKIGAVLPALQRDEIKGLSQGGLRFSLFRGDWDELPDFQTLKADSAGVAGKDFNLNSSGNGGGFACVMNGFLEIKHKGYYIFTKVDGNDDSRVFIGDKLVLGSVRGFLRDNEESYLVPLDKGFYPIKIEYWRRKGAKALQPIYIKPEGQDDFPLLVEMLFSTAK